MRYRDKLACRALAHEKKKKGVNTVKIGQELPMGQYRRDTVGNHQTPSIRWLVVSKSKGSTK